MSRSGDALLRAAAGIALALLLCPVVAVASGRLGGTAVNLGVGARAEAMGGAFVAIADDASALHWNPAGLGLVGDSRLSGTHTEWLGGVRYEWLGFVQPVRDLGSLGLGGTFLFGGNVVHTVETPAGVEERGTFAYTTKHLQVALGSKPLGRFRVGGGVEVARDGSDARLARGRENRRVGPGEFAGAVVQTDHDLISVYFAVYLVKPTVAVEIFEYQSPYVVGAIFS